jgi:hypothetical protein
VLLPVYAAFIAALVFYLLIPIVGAFMLRGQWRRFRERVALLGLAPRLKYREAAEALREGRAEVGRYRLQGTIEAIEGVNRVWVRGKEVSALVDLSRAPLYVLAPGSEEAPTEAGSIERLRWNSVSSLVEGTNIFVAGLLVLEGDRPVFVDRADEPLIAVCHEGGEERLITRLIAGGRAPNEYWNYPTRISISLGLVAMSAILLLYQGSALPTLRSLIFLAGAGPVLPFAPPGLLFFFAYHRLWRRALASRTARDLLRLPLRYSERGGDGTAAYARKALDKDEEAPAGATRIGLGYYRVRERNKPLTLFTPTDPEDSAAETMIVEGDPEALVRKAERDAFFYAVASGLAFALAIIVNFSLAFILWRYAL